MIFYIIIFYVELYRETHNIKKRTYKILLYLASFFFG